MCYGESGTYFNIRKQKTALGFFCCREVHYFESLIAGVFLKLEARIFFFPFTHLYFCLSLIDGSVFEDAEAVALNSAIRAHTSSARSTATS